MLLVIGGTLAVMVLDLGDDALTALTIAAVALCLASAIRLRGRARRSKLIFCTDRAGQLYCIDANRLVRARHGLPGYEAMQRDADRALETLLGGELARRLEEIGGVDSIAMRICALERLDERRGGWSALCRVRYPGGGEGRERIPIAHGIKDQDLLLREFERLTAAEL